MLALLAAILAGVLLAMSGAALALQELKLIDTRIFHREATARRIAPSLQAVQAANAVFASGPSWRIDLTAARFDLDALLLELPSHRSDRAALDRARASATATLAGSPLHGRAWCLLTELMVRSGGLTGQAARALQLCYDVAPRDIAVVERRLFLSLTNWPLLTPELRQSATRDINDVLADAEFGPWLAERLAFAAVLLAPERAGMLESAVKAQGERLRPAYERAVQGYRATTRSR